MSRLALAWSDHEEIMLVWLQFCFPIESTISSGFPVISNNDLSLLAKLENFSGLWMGWQTGEVAASCPGTECLIMGADGHSPGGPLSRQQQITSGWSGPGWFSQACKLSSENFASPAAVCVLVGSEDRDQRVLRLPHSDSGRSHHRRCVCFRRLSGELVLVPSLRQPYLCESRTVLCINVMNKAQRPRTPPKINLQSGRVSDLPPITQTVAGMRTSNLGESERCKEVTDNVLSGRSKMTRLSTRKTWNIVIFLWIWNDCWAPPWLSLHSSKPRGGKYGSSLNLLLVPLVYESGVSDDLGAGW